MPLKLALALLYIVAQAFVITFLGFRIGARANARLDEHAELVAGALLIILGVVIVAAEALGITVV